MLIRPTPRCWRATTAAPSSPQAGVAARVLRAWRRRRSRLPVERRLILPWTGHRALRRAADGVVCVLPTGQSASTAGRYLLQVGGEIDMRMIGMQPGGFDNAPLIATMTALAGPPGNNTPGPVFAFPPLPNQSFTYWYFSQPLTMQFGGTVDCKSYPSESYGASTLVFAPGVVGAIQEWGPAGYGENDIRRCAITSLGGGRSSLPTPGVSTIPGIASQCPSRLQSSSGL